MTELGYALIGLTVTAAVLIGAVTFALLRISANVRTATRTTRETSTETALLSDALQEAVGKLRAQGQAMSARAAASDELRSKIADSLTAGLLVVDGAGRVELLNAAGRRLLELSTEPVGVHYAEALSAPALAHVIAECATTGNPIVRRSVEMASSIAATHFGVTVSPLQTDGARGAICLFSDLTEVVQLEEQLRLKETLARLGELTAGIAHEFRNGLATIHGYSRLLDPDALPPHYRPYIEGIRQETELLGKVVTNFLNFAKPEKVVFTPLNLESVARRAAGDIQHELPTGSTVRVDGEFAEIQGDEIMLRQVFGNLLRNAAEACAAVGKIPAIAINAHVDPVHRTCRVAVEDNGPGIAASEREHVFRPFFTTRSQGTGLGLAIVQKIVVTHLGRVAAGSSPEGGASIQLTFPLP